jgi:hypothetical protein
VTTQEGTNRHSIGHERDDEVEDFGAGVGEALWDKVGLIR